VQALKTLQIQIIDVETCTHTLTGISDRGILKTLFGQLVEWISSKDTTAKENAIDVLCRFVSQKRSATVASLLLQAGFADLVPTLLDELNVEQKVS